MSMCWSNQQVVGGNLCTMKIFINVSAFYCIFRSLLSQKTTLFWYYLGFFVRMIPSFRKRFDFLLSWNNSVFYDFLEERATEKILISKKNPILEKCETLNRKLFSFGPHKVKQKTNSKDFHWVIHTVKKGWKSERKRYQHFSIFTDIFSRTTTCNSSFNPFIRSFMYEKR